MGPFGHHPRLRRRSALAHVRQRSRWQVDRTRRDRRQRTRRAQAEGRIAHLEVRLHDFAREVEARLETRALQLDSLVVAGDREIVRLSTILNQLELADGGSTRQPDVTHYAEPRPKIATAAQSSPEKNVPPAQVEMVGHLNEAGYSVDEIAQIIGRAPDVVSSLLKKAAYAALLRTETLLRTGSCAPRVARSRLKPALGPSSRFAAAYRTGPRPGASRPDAGRDRGRRSAAENGKNPSRRPPSSRR